MQTRLLTIAYCAALLLPLLAQPAAAATQKASVSIEMGSDQSFIEDMYKQQGASMPSGAPKAEDTRQDKRKGTMYWDENWLRIDINGGKGRPDGVFLYEKASRKLYELDVKEKSYTEMPLGDFGGADAATVLSRQSPDWIILRWQELAALDQVEGLEISELGSSEVEGQIARGISISGQGGFPDMQGMEGMKGMEGMESMQNMPEMQGMLDMLGKFRLELWIAEEANLPLSLTFANMGLDTLVKLSDIENLEHGSEFLQILGDYTLVEREPEEMPAEH